MDRKKIDITEAKMQPHDTETELAVLSSLMAYNENYSRYGDMLDVDLFYYERERAMYRCVAGVIEDGGITDINSMFNYAGSHDVGCMLTRTDFAQTFRSINKVTLEQDIERLRDMSKRRRAWRLLQESAQMVLDMTENADEVLNDAMTRLADLQGDTTGDGIISNDEALAGVMRQVKENRSEKRRSMSSGFKLLDERYVFRPETMTVIAAFTSVGKSALALNIVQSMAKQGIACAYYSLEMSCNELASRLISMDAQLTASSIMNKCLTVDQANKVGEAVGKNSGLPIYYDDKSTTDFNRTIRSIRRMVKTKGVRMAVIDYLQIYAQVSSEKQEEKLGYMARAAKNLAKEMGIAVVLISQLSRGGEHPALNMMRGSGQIEESADNVILIDRPEAYPDNKVTKYSGEYKNASIQNTAKLILSKGRGVGTGCSLVGFNGLQTRFYDIQVADAGNYKEQTEDLPF